MIDEPGRLVRRSLIFAPAMTTASGQATERARAMTTAAAMRNERESWRSLTSTSFFSLYAILVYILFVIL